ncbi:MAG: HAMP domain-containing sensor histidine kinase [Chloroflexota bacterium]|nr:HAMP domain-containing sensor histidine kinase [Chloroflexota bacterium]
MSETTVNVTAALEEARELLSDLIEAARKGTIIPVRLPGQLESIQGAVQRAADAAAKEAEARKAASANGASDPDAAREQAYFISHAIHELRTPMTSIRGYGDMLISGAMGSLTDMQKQFLETMRSNARRMESLLTDVSDTAKIRANSLRVQPKMDMYKNIAMSVEKQMRPVAEQLTRTLTFDTPSGLPILNVDGELLTKAICKLIENGLRYSGDNGEVTVRASADGNRLKISVIDNGIGMTPAELAQLGTIYFRSDREEVRTHKGSGLGIPVVFGVVRALDGTVDVQSEVDKGTTVTIMLTGMS